MQTYMYKHDYICISAIYIYIYDYMCISAYTHVCCVSGVCRPERITCGYRNRFPSGITF